MKRFALVSAALLMLAMPAKAGTITITIVTAGAPCNAGACTKTYTETDANLAKILVAYGPLCQPPGGPPCTALQTVTFWFDSVVQATVAAVTAYYKYQASQAVVPIAPQ